MCRLASGFGGWFGRYGVFSLFLDLGGWGRENVYKWFPDFREFSGICGWSLGVGGGYLEGFIFGFMDAGGFVGPVYGFADIRSLRCECSRAWVRLSEVRYFFGLIAEQCFGSVVL